jgi:hypothetical protein
VQEALEEFYFSRKESRKESKPKSRAPRLASVISAHKTLAKAMIQLAGVRPEIATACALSRIEHDTGINTEPYRRILPGSIETVESLNATNLGKLVGKSAREVNQSLANLGLQQRNERGEWELTDKGKPYGAAYPFSRNGHASHQILWLPTAAKLLSH